MYPELIHPKVLLLSRTLPCLHVWWYQKLTPQVHNKYLLPSIPCAPERIIRRINSGNGLATVGSDIYTCLNYAIEECVRGAQQLEGTQSACLSRQDGVGEDARSLGKVMKHLFYDCRKRRGNHTEVLLPDLGINLHPRTPNDWEAVAASLQDRRGVRRCCKLCSTVPTIARLSKRIFPFINPHTCSAILYWSIADM